MGGTAFLIWGEISENRLQPVPIKRSILDRILGRTRHQEPKITDFGPGAKLFDLPCGELDRLPGDFMNFLKERLPEPCEASKAFFDYASPAVMSVFVRGEQNREKPQPDWYVQFMFSGCAGTAEISAELGSHWAEIWYRECRQRITQEYLDPFGFFPDDDRIDQGPPRTFLPVGRLGHGMYVGNQTSDLDPECPGSKFFEFDAYLMETFIPESELGKLAELDADYASLMSDKRCRCRLCMPDFDPSSLTGLPFET
jgi:hypothetical protein